MNAEPIDLEDLIALLRTSWPARYSRGRILHVHRNAIQLPDGSLIHLRVMVQQIANDDHSLTGRNDAEDQVSGLQVPR